MKRFMSIGLALAFFLTMTGCSEPPQESTPAAGGDEAASSTPDPADDSPDAFTDGFETGDSSEWKEKQAKDRKDEKAEDDETEGE